MQPMAIRAETTPCDSFCEDGQVLVAVVLQWLLVPPQEQLSPAVSLLASAFSGLKPLLQQQAVIIWAACAALGARFTHAQVGGTVYAPDSLL